MKKSIKYPTKIMKTDVIKLLKEDHKKVKELFENFKELVDKKSTNVKKEKIVQKICSELTLHTLAEESLVYPTVREVIRNEDLMDEADVEHAGAKILIKELQTMSPQESHYDAKVTVLKQYIEHHVKEEEKKMFPKLKDSDVDRYQLGQEVINFKLDLKDSELKKFSSKKNNSSHK